MTALRTLLAGLLEKCSPLPWALDGDDRPRMSWNNHIVQAARPHLAIAFMSHDNTETNAECIANAHLIVEAVNAIPALLAPDWRPVADAPRDRFILLYCPEDNSRWLAKWQGGRWHGVDELGLTRESMGPDDVTGWRVTAWQPLPAPPKEAQRG